MCINYNYLKLIHYCYVLSNIEHLLLQLYFVNKNWGLFMNNFCVRIPKIRRKFRHFSKESYGNKEIYILLI